LSLARQGFERAARMDSLQPTYQLALGLLHERQQQYRRARAAYLQALRLDSTFIKACSQLHNLYLHSLGREDSAMYFNRLLLRQQPTHPLGWKNEGDYLLRKALSIRQQTQQALLNETLQKAIEAYSAALLADTGYVQARYNRGYCYFLTDQHQQAMEDFERLLRRDSLHAQAHFMLGSIYEFYADTEKARFHYTQVLKAQPAHADARQALKELATKP
ncbi:MAG: tetratricopeptide repeat protein, partial [Bacteroidetes bacterium]